MRTPHQTQQQDIDVLVLWQGLRRSLRGLLALTIAVALLVFGALSLLPPQYTSEAQLTIVAKPANPSVDAQRSGSAGNATAKRIDNQAINTHVNQLMAPDLLLRVAGKLKLSNDGSFGASGIAGGIDQTLQLIGLRTPSGPGSSGDQLVVDMQERLQVFAIADSRSIGIRFSSRYRKLSADFVNTLAETYRQGLVDAQVKETRKAVDALSPLIAKLSSDALVADTKAESLRARIERLRTESQSAPENRQRLAALRAQMIEAEAERSVAESKWKSAVDLSHTGNISELPEVRASTTMQKLVKQRERVEQQLAKAKRSLRPTHPRTKQLISDLAGINRSIKGQVQQIIRGLEKTFRTASFRVSDLKKDIAGIPVTAVDTSQDEAQLKSLMSSAQTKRAELVRLQRQLEDKKALAATRTVPIEARIVSTARPADAPSFPKKVPYTLLAMVATFILGLALLTAREIILAESTLRKRSSESTNEDDEEFTAGMPGLSADLGAHERYDAAEPDADEDEVYEEEADEMTIHGVAEHLLQRGEEVAGFRTVIVGETHGIDASQEGMDLARHLSQAELQVVVIDCNTDNESFCETIGLACRPGITELLAGTASFDDVITHIPNSRVHHISLGHEASAEDFYFDGDDLNAVLDALDDVYDQILVVGRYRTAQALFEAVEGRFDAGISVSDA
ncbi:MAG: exopolysaccharide transport family protein, partial [Pseudomonadota bacterium]